MGSHFKRTSAALVLALVAASVLMGLVALAPAASADYTTLPWRASGYVSANPGFTRTTATTFADGQGHVYVFYNTQNHTTSLWNVNVTVYATRGSNDLPRRLFDTQVDGATNTVVPSRVAVAMDGSGNLYAAFVENRGSGNQVFVAMSSDGATSWSSEVQVSNNGGSNAIPALAVSHSGTLYVAWNQVWGSENIGFASSTDQGATFTPEVNVSAYSSLSGTTGVSLAVDSGGRLYVAYDFYSRTRGYWVGNLSRSDDAGATWQTATTFSNANSNVFVPSLLVDASGLIHLAWIDTPGNVASVEYSQSSDQGTTWSAPIQLSAGAGTVTSSRLSMAESGGALMVAWSGVSGANYGMGWTTSPDQGNTWYAAQVYAPGPSFYLPQISVDENGTFYAAPDATYSSTTAVSLLVWFGPPSVPTITGFVRATGQLTVSWTAAPEPNVVGYRVYRSANGLTFSFVASVAAGTTSYVDTGLANGTYWYEVTAINDELIQSNPSAPASSTVGLTNQEMIDQLNAEIAALQNQLSVANGNLASAQTQLNAIKGQLATIQGNTTALQKQINDLQNQINNLQAQQATQTISFANLAFEVIVVVLLVVLLLNQMRRPKSPQLMMAQPGQVPPKQPEDDL